MDILWLIRSLYVPCMFVASVSLEWMMKMSWMFGWRAFTAGWTSILWIRNSCDLFVKSNVRTILYEDCCNMYLFEMCDCKLIITDMLICGDRGSHWLPLWSFELLIEVEGYEGFCRRSLYLSVLHGMPSTLNTTTTRHEDYLCWAANIDQPVSLSVLYPFRRSSGGHSTATMYHEAYTWQVQLTVEESIKWRWWRHVVSVFLCVVESERGKSAVPLRIGHINYYSYLFTLIWRLIMKFDVTSDWIINFWRHIYLI